MWEVINLEKKYNVSLLMMEIDWITLSIPVMKAHGLIRQGLSLSFST